MENFEEFGEMMEGLEKFLGIMEKINKAAEESVFDSISTPIAQFELVTGEDPVVGGYMTLCHIPIKDAEEKKIACISTYDTFEEAMEGHREWRSIIIDNPPAILKDVKKDTIIYI